MKKRKLTLNKETLKNLTLDDHALAQVVGAGLSGVGPIGGTVGNWPSTVNTTGTCHSCAGASCLACPGGITTSVIYPGP